MRTRAGVTEAFFSQWIEEVTFLTRWRGLTPEIHTLKMVTMMPVRREILDAAKTYFGTCASKGERISRARFNWDLRVRKGLVVSDKDFELAKRACMKHFFFGLRGQVTRKPKATNYNPWKHLYDDGE